MTNSRTFRAKSPSDLLAMVPCVLGFHPQDSLVLLTLGGEPGQVHARVDLPGDETGMAEAVDVLSSAVRRNGVRRVAVVAYSDDQCLSLETVGRLRTALEEGGVEVCEAVRADGERWYSLSGCDGPCCPVDGVAYDVASHPITAQSVLDGQVTHHSRQDLADSLVGTDVDALDAVAAAADRAMVRFQGAARYAFGMPQPEQGRRHLVAEGHWVRDRVRRFLADGLPLDAAEAGRLLVALVVIEVRDVAWAEMTRESAEAHVDLWRDVVRRAPHDLLAAPAALLGFAAWLSGDGALAWCAIDRCQQAEPDYRLASLLTHALSSAIPPSSWEPLPAAHLTLFAG